MPAIGRADAAEIESGSKRLQALLSRSATDMAFRHRLLSSPRAAIKEFSGSDVPDGLRVEFIENKGGPTVVLPPFVDADAALSEQELEAVAGGSEPVTTVILTVAAAIGSAVVSAEGMLWVLKHM